MNSKQSSTKTMYRRVSNYFKKIARIVSGLPSFLIVQTAFDTNLQQMDIWESQQETDLGGLRTKKEDLKEITTQKLLETCGSLNAFATITGDVVLVKKVNYAEGFLMKAADNKFLTYCNIISGLAEAYQVAAAEYGITTESVAELKADIEAYKDVVDEPKTGTTGKKQATDQLAQLFEIQGVQMGKLDTLMELLRFKNPAVYAEYWDVRRITYRTGSLSVICEITDVATGLPLAGAMISFYLNGILVLEKTTSTTGGVTVKSFVDGTYTVTVTRLGYVSQNLTVNVLSVELTVIKVALVKE